MKKQVVIVGAGISGMTAAYNLLKYHQDKFDVLILEAENECGGQARCFDVKCDDNNTRKIEHGSHVFFQYYTNVINLINELKNDPDKNISSNMPEFSQVKGWTICDPDGNKATLEQSIKFPWSILPSTISVFPSVLSIPWLSFFEKLKVGWATLKLTHKKYDDFNEFVQKTSEKLGLQEGYSEKGINSWNAASLGLTNLFVSEQSATLLVAKNKVLIKYPNGLSYKLPAGDLSELIANPLKKKIEQLGGRFQFNTTVTEIKPNNIFGKTITYLTSDALFHTEIQANYIIIALPPKIASKLLPWTTQQAWHDLEPVTPVITCVVGLSGKIKEMDNREYGCSRLDYIFSVVNDLSNFWPEYLSDIKSVLRCEIGHANLLPNGVNANEEYLKENIKKDLEKLFPESKNMTVEWFGCHREDKQLYTSWKRGEYSKKPAQIEREVYDGIYLGSDWVSKGTIGLEAAANSGIECTNYIFIKEKLDKIKFTDVPL